VTPAEQREQEERQREQCFVDAGGEREFTPKVADTIRGIWASDKNPQRDGFYVRTVRRERARVNSGIWYELTDGNGNNWQYRASDTVLIAKAGNATAALARKDALLRQAMAFVDEIAMDLLNNQMGEYRNIYTATYKPHRLAGAQAEIDTAKNLIAAIQAELEPK
jgi:hypothetical protein